MKVVLAAEAQTDLEQIADHIAADSPARAVIFLNDLRRCCEQLISTPHAFPLVPRYERLGVRRRVYQRYVIFYRVTGERIDVLHIMHGRRDLDALLFPPQ